MIAKQVAMRSARKSDFGDLVAYITDTQGKAQRVGQVVLTNCTSDNALDAAIEVRLTQQENTRSGADKTYHLVVSFRTGEQPSADVLRAIEQRLCEGLGFGEHQRVSAAHHDTDNLHVHIAINKVHPTRHTVHAPYYDHTTLGKLCEELETTFGLQADNHAAQQRGAQSRAVEMEHRAGVESLVGWVQRECLDRIQGASSWAELHDTLFEHGLELEVRANGFVLTDREGQHAKASSVDRFLSRPRLEQRLGPFEPPAQTPAGFPTPADPLMPIAPAM
ncbi:MAG: conjugal transfer protein TraI, partial [Proteobacteria bacterium]